MSSDSTETAAPKVNRAASAILLLVVALCPLPFGSTDHIIVVLWCMVLGAGLLIAALRPLDRRPIAVVAMTLLLLAACALVLHEQLSEHPFFPAAAPDPIWSDAARLLGPQVAPSVSIVRDQAMFALGPPLAAMLAFLCSLAVCADREVARRLVRVVAVSGALYAAYGIGALLLEPSKVLWRDKQAYFTVLTSTFINRNTAAVYFGSCALIWLVSLLDYTLKLLPGHDTDWRTVLYRLSSRPPRSVLVAAGAFFVCLSAMFLTGSRAGVMISLAVSFAVALFFLRKAVSISRQFWLALAGVSVAVVLLMQIMGGGIQGRLAAEGLAGGGRIETYRSTLKMIGDHPWFGTGLGTFAWSYPAYRSDNISSWGTWDRAHSTPLEIAAELGLPLAGLVACWWLVVLGTLWRGVLIRRRDRAIPLMAMAIGGIALLHSAIDFSLQIPGFAIVVFALLGAGVAQSFRSVR